MQVKPTFSYKNAHVAPHLVQAPKESASLASSQQASVEQAPVEQPLAWEQQLSKVLNGLPQHVLTQENRTSQKTIVANTTLTFLGVFMPFLTLGTATLLGFQNSWLAVISLISMVYGGFLSISQITKAEKFKRAFVDKNRLANRRQLLASLIKLCSCPVLKGQVSEVFFLVESPNIAFQFWDELALVKNEALNALQDIDLATVDRLKTQYRLETTKTP